MYGIGYLQTYGLALVCASWPGLVGALYMQVCIMVFNELVEKPHFLSLLRAAGTLRRDGRREELHAELEGRTAARVS
jgi:hypothetical protein